MNKNKIVFLFLQLLIILSYHRHYEQQGAGTATYSTTVSSGEKETSKELCEKERHNNATISMATSKRATMHTLDHLLYVLKLKTISGTLICKFSTFQQNYIQFDLVEKFLKVTKFIEENGHKMHDHAPDACMNPLLPFCRGCGEINAMQPLITKK
jgi:DNA polymerase I-like protein with 3'-5' exonuclease and polymerase domains